MRQPLPALLLQKLLFVVGLVWLLSAGPWDAYSFSTARCNHGRFWPIVLENSSQRILDVGMRG